MKNRYISLGLLLLVVALIAVPGATARPAYFSALQSVYGTSGTSCNTCHTSIPSLNDYGNKFASVSSHSSNPSGALKSIGAPPGVVVPTPTPGPSPTPAPSPAPAELKKIIVTPAAANLGLNGIKLFKAEPRDQNGKVISAAISWMSSNPDVGIIDTTGKFTALKAGKTTITASSGKINGSAKITVTSRKSNNHKENKKHKEHKEHKKNKKHKESDELKEHKDNKKHHDENEHDDRYKNELDED